jgi:NADH dehydrogenase (ubiquinone) 1 alpha subcomplex subunit 8
MSMCDKEDFMLCKNENREPAHCLKEGRKVTRCATDLCVT